MTNEELKAALASAEPQAAFEENKQYLMVTVPAENLHSFAAALKNKQELGFDYLFCLTAVDWVKHFTVVYHLASTQHKHSIVLKANIADRTDPRIDSVCDIWKTADFHEREVFDMYGIRFNNHPDLRRILLEDNWMGFPMRKDYADEYMIEL